MDKQITYADADRQVTDADAYRYKQTQTNRQTDR